MTRDSCAAKQGGSRLLPLVRAWLRPSAVAFEVLVPLFQDNRIQPSSFSTRKLEPGKTLEHAGTDQFVAAVDRLAHFLLTFVMLRGGGPELVIM
jgi:hypothetical protein